MKLNLSSLLILFSIICLGQGNVEADTNLIINHGDITLYLSNDTSTLASKHTIKYSDFLNLDSDRDDRWFKDTYKGKYSKAPYKYSGYDLGHLTPSHITSYNDTLNHASFSLFNQAPQLASFNRGKWAKLERHVEDSISKYKMDATIITGVIYDINDTTYLSNSRIKIPTSYFKVLIIGDKIYCWIGSNIHGSVIPITLDELNEIFCINESGIKIT